MNSNKIINGLSYISIIFAPFLFPLIVLLVSNDTDVKSHARHALKLHIVPVLLTIAIFAVTGLTGLFSQSQQATGVVFVIALIAIIILDVAIAVYNIVIGIKLLLS